MPRIKLDDLEFDGNARELWNFRAFRFNDKRYEILSSISLQDINPIYGKLFEVKSDSGNIFYCSMGIAYSCIPNSSEFDFGAFEPYFFLMSGLRDNPDDAVLDNERDNQEGIEELKRIAERLDEL